MHHAHRFVGTIFGVDIFQTTLVCLENSSKSDIICMGRPIVYISLRRTTNGHMCTLDSGGVLALHLSVGVRYRCSPLSRDAMRWVHIHNMFLSGVDF